jgi:UDP-N-acetylmuramoyl-tripeptide--D-alanyl-D-alanine ligase
VEQAGAGWTVIDDSYTASPPTVTAALTLLAELPVRGRRWAVLGQMAELGPTSADQHRAVGALIAERHVDRLVVVGEEAGALADGAVAAGLASAAVDRGATAEEALVLVRRDLVAGDAVLVKGSRVAGLERVARDLLGADTAVEAQGVERGEMPR